MILYQEIFKTYIYEYNRNPFLAKNWSSAYENLFQSRPILKTLRQSQSLEIAQTDFTFLNREEISLFEVSKQARAEKKLTIHTALAETFKGRFDFKEPKKPKKRKTNDSYDEEILESKISSEFTSDMINPDERAQMNLLRQILSIWYTYEGEQPLPFWEIFISDKYSETIENLFFITILSKLKIIKIWESQDFNSVVFVPDYDVLHKSKFGANDPSTGLRKFPTFLR